MEPALTLECGDEVFTFDDDEFCALSELSFLYGQDGAKLGRMLVARATFSARAVRSLDAFVQNVRAKLDQPLVVYDHGRGSGTVCFQRRPWYELVKRSGIRYEKPTPRYVKGHKGKLASIDDVVYARGRSVKDPAAKPQPLRDVLPVATAFEKLERVVARALAGATLSTRPRTTYEYF